MADAACTIALLHTSLSNLHQYYNRHGYRSAPVLSVVAGLPLPLCGIASAITTMETNLDGDPSVLDGVAAVHSSASWRMCGHFARTAAYWTKWIKPQQSVRVVTAAGATKIQAYWIVRIGSGPVFGGLLQVTEFFSLGETVSERKEHFAALLRDQLAEVDPMPRAIRVPIALIEPSWLEGGPAAPYQPLGPLQSGRTLVHRQAGPELPSGLQVWADEGQMYRAVSDKDEDGSVKLAALFSSRDDYTFLAADAF